MDQRFNKKFLKSCRPLEEKREKEKEETRN
jgi:hypothetical protein